MLEGVTMTDWHVVGRADKDKQMLLLECQLTGKLGYVDLSSLKSPLREEQWDRAGHAMRHNAAYRWNPKWGEVTELTATVA